MAYNLALITYLIRLIVLEGRIILYTALCLARHRLQAPNRVEAAWSPESFPGLRVQHEVGDDVL